MDRLEVPEQPGSTLGDVLASLAGRVGYLRAEPSVPVEDGWAECDRFLADPAAVDAAISSSARARGTDDPQVAASIFAQSYAYKVSSVAVGAYALGLAIPSVRADDLAVRLADGRARGLAFRSDHLDDSGDPAALAKDLFGGHIGALVEAIRARVRIGERLLWGNAAASCAAALRAVEGAARDRLDPSERAAIRQRAGSLVAASSPWIGGLGHFERVEVDGSDGWYWTRSNCCLWYRSSGGPTCDDCSLIPTDKLLARRLAEIGGAS